MEIYKVYWHCLGLSPDETKNVEIWMKELAAHLVKPPVAVRLDAKPLSKELAADLKPILRNPPECEEPLRNCWEQFADRNPLGKTDWAPLLVCCRPDSAIALAVKKANPGAKVSRTIDSVISVVYTPLNQNRIWMETLTLLGADFCEPSLIPDDCKRGCLIWSSKKTSKEEEPFLCPENVTAIQNYFPPTGVPPKHTKDEPSKNAAKSDKTFKLRTTRELVDEIAEFLREHRGQTYSKKDLEKALIEAGRIRKDGYSDEDFSKAKQYLIKNGILPLRTDIRGFHLPKEPPASPQNSGNPTVQLLG